MNKPELIAAVANKSGLSQAAVRSVLDAAGEVVSSTLISGGDVFLLGVGKLSVSERSGKVARDIRRGTEVVVPPRRVAVFRQSDTIKRALNVGYEKVGDGE